MAWLPNVCPNVYMLTFLGIAAAQSSIGTMAFNNSELMKNLGDPPAPPLTTEWAEQCNPSYTVTSLQGVPAFQCGSKIGDQYTICSDSNPADRKQEPNEMSPCECAKKCLDVGSSCVVMSYQQDADHPERAAGKWKNTRCFLYKKCTKQVYTANRNRWCMAVGSVAYATTLGAAESNGWGLVIVIMLGASAYVVGGVVVGRHRRVDNGKRNGLGLSTHPHYLHWVEIHALCADGIAFARNGKRTRTNEGGGREALAVDNDLNDRMHKDESVRSTTSSRTSSPPSESKRIKRNGTKDRHKEKRKARHQSRPKEESNLPTSAAEWQPTRSLLQQGARETGVKVTDHVPGQGLVGLR